MKKIKFTLYRLLTFMLPLLLFMNCTKDSEDTIETIDNSLKEFEVVTYGSSGVFGRGSSTNIAVFSNQEAYDNLVADLENQIDAWDDGQAYTSNFKRKRRKRLSKRRTKFFCWEFKSK